MIDADSFLNEFKDLSKDELIERIHKLYTIVDDTTRIKFLNLLNKLQDNTHFDKVENYFISDSNPEVKVEAAKLLAFNYEGMKAIKPLIWVIENEKSLDVRLTAIRLLVALSCTGKFDDVIHNILKDLLASKEYRIKMEVIESIEILQITSAFEDLISLLGSSEKNVLKTKIIRALGELKCERAIPFLVDHLGKESFDLWYFSFHALKNILGEKLLEILVRELKQLMGQENEKELTYTQTLRLKGIIQAIGMIGTENEARKLIKLVKHDQYWVQDEVIKALDKIEPQWREKYKEEIY